MKIVVAIAFIAILGALGAAGLLMVRGGRTHDSSDGRMMRALALRVALSVALFAGIIFAFWIGWIQPTGFSFGR